MKIEERGPQIHEALTKVLSDNGINEYFIYLTIPACEIPAFMGAGNTESIESGFGHILSTDKMLYRIVHNSLKIASEHEKNQQGIYDLLNRKDIPEIIKEYVIEISRRAGYKTEQ